MLTAGRGARPAGRRRAGPADNGAMSWLSAPGLIVLRERNFALYLSARLLSALAVQMQSVAIGWQVYALTGSLVDLGLVGLAQFLPFLLLILPAGQAADRIDRRRIIAACMALNFVCALALLGFTVSGLQAVWPVFAVLTLFGSARAFSLPASQAILIKLVPAERFPQAVAIGSSSFHVAVIAGPVLGGLLYLAGPAVVYSVVALLLAGAASLTTAALAWRPITRHVGRWMFGGVALFGAATIVFGVSGSLALSLAALVTMGAGDMVSVYIRHILVQSETPDAIRGRVSAVSAVFIGASNELGEFESGITAGWFGLVPAVIVGGLATLGVTALWMRLFPSLRTMDRFPHLAA